VIVRRDVDRVHPPQPASNDQLAQRGQPRIEPAHEPDLNRDAGRLDLADERHRLCDVGGERRQLDGVAAIDPGDDERLLEVLRR